jgi:hypothetical protein
MPQRILLLMINIARAHASSEPFTKYLEKIMLQILVFLVSWLVDLNKRMRMDVFIQRNGTMEWNGME